MTSDLTAFERLLRLAGVSRIRKGESLRYLEFPADFSDRHIKVHRSIEKFTMTRPERTYALYESVRYVLEGNVDGAFVECGVWRGGSVMAMALALQDFGENRDIFLFDTFEGMTPPTDHDVSVKGDQAKEIFDKTKKGAESADWAFAPIDEVKRNVLSTGYPESRFHFVKGRVEDTIPDQAPDQIALLRLDTDFYESTKHELVHLFPRLSSRGVIIIDDYGHWQGARKAVDEYLDETSASILLNRVDFAARIAVKP